MTRTDHVARLRDPAHRGLALGVVGVVVAFAFEAIAVATAMPVAARELHGLRAYALAFSVFLAASLVGMALAGEVSDRRGPALPVGGSAVLFVAGLLVATAAPSMAVLVVARGVQGLGAGLGVVALYVVVARAFPEELRPRAFAAMSAGWVLPSIVGPPVAGFLADQWSWRWVVRRRRTAHRRLHAPGPAPRAQAPGPGRRPGRRGAGAAQPGLAGDRGGAGHGCCCSTPVRRRPGAPRCSASSPRSCSASACRGCCRPGALRLARGLPTVVTLRGVYAGAFFGAETFVPLMLVEQRGLSTTLAGAALTGAALTWALGSWYQGRPALHVPRTTLVSAGLGLVAAGIGVATLTLLPAAPAATAALGWAVGGLGMGVGVTSLSVLVLELSRPTEQGVNSAALQVSDALGAVLLVGAAGAVFAALHEGSGGSARPYLVVFVSMTVIAVAGALVSGRVREPVPARR